MLRLDLLGGGRRASLVAIHDDDSSTTCAQPPRYGTADAAGTSGDDSNAGSTRLSRGP